MTEEQFFANVQFLVGKKINNTIRANLTRKYGKNVRIITPGEEVPMPPKPTEEVHVLLDKADKITAFKLWKSHPDA